MFDAFKKKYDRTPEGLEDRVPPGQYVTEKFPVLHYGDVPRYENIEQTWDLRVWAILSNSPTFLLQSYAPSQQPPSRWISTA